MLMGDIFSSCGHIESLRPSYISNISVFDAWKEFHRFGFRREQGMCDDFHRRVSLCVFGHSKGH